MWIISSVGFFSAVQKSGTDFLTIRARADGDLERLKKKYIPELSDTIAGQGTDYPYRATVSHADFAKGLAKMSGDINYHNFKDMILAKFGYEREKIYARVWGILQGLTKLK